MKLAPLAVALFMVAISFSTYAPAQQPPPAAPADKSQPANPDPNDLEARMRARRAVESAPENAQAQPSKGANPSDTEQRIRQRRAMELGLSASPEAQQLRAKAEQLRAEAAALQAQADRMAGEPGLSTDGPHVVGVGPGAPGMAPGGGYGGAVGGPGDRGTYVVTRSAPYGGTVRIGSPDQVDRMRNWLDTVERYVRLTRNPVDSAVASVITANDLLRPRGPEAAIDYFNKILPKTKNESVQRAIRLQLIELYKMKNQQEAAFEQLEALMTSVPSNPAPESPR